jgi:hypothetical protein
VENSRPRWMVRRITFTIGSPLRSNAGVPSEGWPWIVML